MCSRYLRGRGSHELHRLRRQYVFLGGGVVLRLLVDVRCGDVHFHGWQLDERSGLYGVYGRNGLLNDVECHRMHCGHGVCSGKVHFHGRYVDKQSLLQLVQQRNQLLDEFECNCVYVRQYLLSRDVCVHGPDNDE